MMDENEGNSGELKELWELATCHLQLIFAGEIQ